VAAGLQAGWHMTLIEINGYPSSEQQNAVRSGPTNRDSDIHHCMLRC
jgi:hypothetical protein